MTDEQVDDKQTSIRKYLSVIDATCTGAVQDVQPVILLALVERFKGVVELLSGWREGAKSGLMSEVISPNFDLCFW